jgi:hypothetical protein
VSRKKPQLTKAGTPRKRAPGGGAKPKGNLKLTVHIPPDVRAALGSKPGEVITALVRGSNALRQARAAQDVADTTD